MAISAPILITILLYASIGLSITLIRGCDRDVCALKRQSEEIRLGITRLRAAANP